MSKPYEGRSSSVLSQRSKSIAQKSIPGFCVFRLFVKRKPLVQNLKSFKPTAFSVPKRFRTSDLPLRRTLMRVFL